MTRVPVAIGLLGVVGLILAVNRFAPELFTTIIALLALYLFATHADKAAGLFQAMPAALEALFHQPGPPAWSTHHL